MLSTLLAIGLFVWIIGGEREPGRDVPEHILLAESSVALAYQRHAPGHRCRVAESGGDHFALCSHSGQTGGALYALLPSQPGRSLITPQTGRAMQHVAEGFFADVAVDVAPTRYDVDTGLALAAFE